MDIEALMKMRHLFVLVAHCYREANWVADDLSKFGARSSSASLQVSDKPSYVSSEGVSSRQIREPIHSKEMCNLVSDQVIGVRYGWSGGLGWCPTALLFFKSDLILFGGGVSPLCTGLAYIKKQTVVPYYFFHLIA